jgi:hypothetical protein
MTCSRSGGEPMVAEWSKRNHWSQRNGSGLSHTDKASSLRRKERRGAQNRALRLVKTIGEEDEDASRRVGKESLQVSVRDDKA